MSSTKRPVCKATSCIFLLALVFFIAPWATVAQQAAQASQKISTRPLPPKRYSPNRDFDMRHIALDLHFDWEREWALGTATLTFAPLSNNLRKVEFDAANMSIRSVKLSSGQDLQYENIVAREKLRITLDRVYQPADLISVVVSYHTNGPTRASTTGEGGLTFIKPTADEPNRPRQIWSQGESEWNHQWFPCFDYPNDFATSELTATVERPLTVISNGVLIEKKETPDGKQTFHWKMTEPHASYLTSIVVGDFKMVEQSHNGIPIQSYVYSNQVEAANITLARVPAMMKFFEDRTGVKYPHGKYGQTFVYGFGGGMENISATTMSDETIHDLRSELDRTEDGLLAHELSHSWFGNNVTCRSWSDLWLNESFATYMAGLWTEHDIGHDDFLYSNIRSDHVSYLNAWTKGVRRPIVTKNYHEPDALFDVYAYARGSAVLHMLRVWLGDELWWRSLNHYLRKHAHQPVETEELRVAIEESTGQPLEWFFDEWVYTMGHPVFRVTQDYNQRNQKLTLKVRQEQRIDAESAYPQTRFFETPVDIEIVTSGKTTVERVLLEAKEEQSITFEVASEPLIVNFDYGDTVIDELVFVKPTPVLLYQLKNDEDAMGRLRALDQLASRSSDSSTSQNEKNQIVDAIGVALKSDKFWGVRVEAAKALSQAFRLESGDASRSGKPPAVAARSALLAALDDKKARVRTAALEALSASNDQSLATTYIRMLGDQSYATIRVAALALGATKSENAYAALRALSSDVSWRDSIRASSLQGLAALGDSRALDLGLKYAAGTNPKEVRLAAVALLGSVGKGDPRVFPIVSEAFVRAVLSGSTSSTDATARALILLGDPRAIGVFEAARNGTERPEFKFLIAQFEQQLRQIRASQ